MKYLLFSFSCISYIIAWGQSIPLPEISNKFVVIAHRGNHLHAPENTLLSIQHAIDDGADYVEVDLRSTSDGELVIMHDRSIDRMMKGQGLLSGYTLRELKTMPIQAQEAPGWGWFTIPTFREVLEFCKGRIHIYLDFKDASVLDTYELIDSFGMKNQIVVYINSSEQYSEWRRIAKDIPLMASLPEQIQKPSQLKAWLNKNRVDVLDGGYLSYNRAMVKKANKSKIPIWADIQSKDESPKNWDLGIKLGLQGLQTDHPKALIAYILKDGKSDSYTPFF